MTAEFRADFRADFDAKTAFRKEKIATEKKIIFPSKNG